MSKNQHQSANPVEIQSYLKGVSYPARRQDLFDRAEDNGAPGYILELLERVEDREYMTPAELTREIGTVKAM